MNIIGPEFTTPIYIHLSLASRVGGRESFTNGIGRGVSIVVSVSPEQILDFETRQKHPKRKGSYRLLPGKGSICQCYSLPVSSSFPSSYLFFSCQENGILEEYQLASDGIFQARLAGESLLKATLAFHSITGILLLTYFRLVQNSNF